MARKFNRRFRRNTSPEAIANKRENQQGFTFFGNSAESSFFPPSSSIQRKCEKCEEEDKKVNRIPDKKEEEKLQKKEGKATATGSSVSSYVHSLPGNGNAIPLHTQQFFSARMGHDFSHVKVHTGKDAATSAKDVNAKAYTVGNHIVFNDGQFNTESSEGKKLLAHELAHVMQNDAGENTSVKRQTQTPVPATATVDPTTQVATFTINSVNVVVEPDQTLRRGTSVTFHGQSYRVNRTGALTVNYLRPRLVPSYTGSGRNRRVSSVSLSFNLYIKTYFGTAATSADTSAYGRGTTQADIAAGNTSLGFHEGRHGQDYQDYITNNPLPSITLAVPASIREYNAAVRAFNAEMRTYSSAMGDYSHTNTDMVGTPEP